MQPTEIQLLYDYNHWATARILSAMEQLPADIFTEPNTLVWGSLRGTLVHVMRAEWAWHARCLGTSPPALPDEDEFSTLANLIARWRDVEAAMRALVTGIGTKDLTRMIHYRTTSGIAQAQPLWQILVHVVNHGTQHRAEVAHVLTELGASPGDVDFIVYLRSRATDAPAG